jgi:hypothetical protein
MTMSAIRVTMDEKPGIPNGPKWLRINGDVVNCAEGVDRQRDEVIIAIARKAYEMGYAAAQTAMRDALGLITRNTEF